MAIDNPLKSSWILVTGGAGYIGSHCIVDLLQNNYNVVVIDNLTEAQHDNIKPESLIRVEKITERSVEYFSMDIRDTDKMDALFNRAVMTLW